MMGLLCVNTIFRLNYFAISYNLRPIMWSCILYSYIVVSQNIHFIHCSLVAATT